MSKTDKSQFPKVGLLEKNSYCISQAMSEFLSGAFSAYVFFFYETEIKLAPLVLALCFSLFTIYDSVNDPLMGYLTDRTFKFTKKLGRRFPWVALGIFPWAITYIFIFTSPSLDPVADVWLIFGYLLVILCIHDTFLTMWTINSEALFPAKFPDLDERRSTSGLKALWGIIGLVAGIIIPPLFVEYGDINSYLTQAFVLMIIGIIAGILMLPGHRESKQMLEHYFESGAAYAQRENFLKTLIKALKKKNFLLITAFHFFYYILTGLLVGSMNYFLRYNLNESADSFMIVMVGYLIGSLVTIPIWVKVAQRWNDNKKLVVIGGTAMALATLPVMFINTLTLLIITGALIGITGGIFFVLQDAIFADVIDEAVSIDGIRQESSYFGIKIFLSRFSSIAQSIIIAVVHIATGFDPNLPTQTPLALFGIRVHLGLVPMISLLVGTLLFWKFYDLTPEKLVGIRAKLGEQNL